MSLDSVRRRLAADAEVAEVAEVAGVAEVAEVFGDPVEPVRRRDVQRLQRSCRGFSQTYAPTNDSEASTCEDRAEVAEVFHCLTRAQARTRARDEKSGGEPVQPVQPPRAPAPATLLRHCRCRDCLNFSRVAGEYFCSEYIGGTSAIWATGDRFCDPPPDTWHYCARYHGSQVSKDVWVWPKVAPQAAQVGAGANISADPANPPSPAEDRDTDERRNLTKVTAVGNLVRTAGRPAAGAAHKWFLPMELCR